MNYDQNVQKLVTAVFLLLVFELPLTHAEGCTLVHCALVPSNDARQHNPQPVLSGTFNTTCLADMQRS